MKMGMFDLHEGTCLMCSRTARKKRETLHWERWLAANLPFYFFPANEFFSKSFNSFYGSGSTLPHSLI